MNDILTFALLSVFTVQAGFASEPVTIAPDDRGLFSQIAETTGQSWNLQTPTPNIVAVHGNVPLGKEMSELQPVLVFNSDATEASLECQRAGEIIVEVAEKSGQQSDGRILFTTADAKVIGSKAKLESHPGNSRIGFWTSLDDSVEWNFMAIRPGSYRVTLCYSRAGTKPAKVAVQVGEEKLTTDISGTGSWYRYQSAIAGSVKIPAKGELTVSVQGLESVGALMNLKGLVLTPISEGKPVQTADADGVIVCHSRNVTIQGVQVQYEPKPEKNTVGYWTHVTDRVSWTVNFPKAGRYDVEILQGCGKGHGGSDVDVVMNDQVLSFVVEDTGHFQNFKPRVIGQFHVEQPGVQQFTIVPRKKASVAVMDVRQVRLIPASQ